MIKFFRRIRQKLLSENKLSKYLIYAIGEIVLVVIGILIALQINTWNENRKTQNLGHSYLLEMMNEVQTDVTFLDNVINKLEQNINNQEAALNTKNINTLSLDSLYMIISPINLDFKLGQVTYDKMKNLGLTKLSNNEDLNKLITTYYNRSIVFINTFKAYQFEFLKKHIDFRLYGQNNIDYYSDFSDIKFPALYKENINTETGNQKKNIIAFIQSVQGRNMILHIFEGKKSALKRWKNFQWETIMLLKSIYEELKKINPKIEFEPNIPKEFNYLFKEVQLTKKELKNYVGTYKLSEERIIEVTLEDNQLYAQPTGLDKLPIFAHAKDSFFLKTGYIKLTFNIENHEVTSLTLLRDKKETNCKKIK